MRADKNWVGFIFVGIHVLRKIIGYGFFLYVKPGYFYFPMEKKNESGNSKQLLHFLCIENLKIIIKFYMNKCCRNMVNIRPSLFILGKTQEVIRSHDRIVESIFFFEDSFETHYQHELEKKKRISEGVTFNFERFES